MSNFFIKYHFFVTVTITIEELWICHSQCYGYKYNYQMTLNDNIKNGLIILARVNKLVQNQFTFTENLNKHG